jgi:hypothetical protein
MIAKSAPSRIVTFCLAMLMTMSAGVVRAQTQIESGFNLFSVDQDQEIGRQSAAEADRQLPILHDRSIEAYVQGIGRGGCPRREVPAGSRSGQVGGPRFGTNEQDRRCALAFRSPLRPLAGDTTGRNASQCSRARFPTSTSSTRCSSLRSKTITD